MTESAAVDSDDDGTEPELLALAEQLKEELQTRPAILAQFTYNWSGSQDQAAAATVRICLFGVLMRRARPTLDLSALKSVVFHHDYEQALRDAGGDRPDAHRPSKEAGGFSVGMMVPRGNDEVSLVMHAGVAFGLASDDIEHRNWAEQIVRHELCHVDDAAFKRRLRAKSDREPTYRGFDVVLGPLAEALWDEFYANKYSHGSWSDPRIWFDLLRDTLPPIRDAIHQRTLAYRVQEISLGELMEFVRPKVKFAAQCFGYAAGALSSMGSTLEAEAPEEAHMLEDFGLRDAWDQCVEALETLDRRWPDWESVLDIMSVLRPACMATFSGFGFDYEDREEGCYVDIPMRDETDPDLQQLLGGFELH